MGGRIALAAAEMPGDRRWPARWRGSACRGMSIYAIVKELITKELITKELWRGKRKVETSRGRKSPA